MYSSGFLGTRLSSLLKIGCGASGSFGTFTALLRVGAGTVRGLGATWGAGTIGGIGNPGGNGRVGNITGCGAWNVAKMGIKCFDCS